MLETGVRSVDGGGCEVRADDLFSVQWSGARTGLVLIARDGLIMTGEGNQS